MDSVVGGSTFCGLVASRSMLCLTLAFTFSRFFGVRVDDSHIIFLESVGPSFCFYTFRLHFVFVQRLNKILTDIKFGGTRTNHQTAKLNSLPNFPAIRYVNATIKIPLQTFAIMIKTCMNLAFCETGKCPSTERSYNQIQLCYATAI